MAYSFYKILDKNGVEMPDHWSGRRRTYDEAKKMVDGLNKNGEHRPYTMIEEDRIGEEYYNDTYGGQGSPDTSPNTQNK